VAGVGKRPTMSTKTSIIFSSDVTYAQSTIMQPVKSSVH
jgi:hypothetical protein